MARIAASLLATLALAGSALADEVELRDPQGRVVQRTDDSGVTTWFVYDESGRLAEERRSDGTVIRHVPRDSQPEAGAR
jgi:YD repeat-containing protein